MIPSQKELAASICFQFGEHYVVEKEYAKAVRSYKDALSYAPTDNKVGSSKPDPTPSLGARCPVELPEQGTGQQGTACGSLRGSGVSGMGLPVWGPALADPRASPPTALGARLGSPHFDSHLWRAEWEDVAESHVSLASSGPSWRWGDNERAAARGSGREAQAKFPGRLGGVREVWLRLGNAAGVHAKRVNEKLSDRPIHSLTVCSPPRFLIHARWSTRPRRHVGQDMVPALGQRSVDKYTSSSPTMRPEPHVGQDTAGTQKKGASP